jgi:hypothetical protein
LQPHLDRYSVSQTPKQQNVARKSKNEADKQTDVPAADRADERAKTSRRPANKPRSTAAKAPKRKSPAKEKGAKAVASPRPESPDPASAATEPSDDAIRLRAYFLAERRARLSLPGDSAHDWIEARRQLLEEAGR